MSTTNKSQAGSSETEDTEVELESDSQVPCLSSQD